MCVQCGGWLNVLCLTLQYQWSEPSRQEDTSAASFATDQQWHLHQAQQGLCEYVTTGGTIHRLGVRLVCVCVLPDRGLILLSIDHSFANCEVVATS